MDCPVCHAQVEGGQKFCPACGSMVPASQQKADPMLGSVIGGKYRVVNLLGEGGMGSVYLAEQKLGTTMKKVAIKTLHKELSRDPKIQARFDREAGTVAELQHPNTIQVFDYGKTDDDQLYIVMEYVQGANVADVLEKGGAMPPARAEAILRQVCGSLEEAHAHGIVHRDLKPENIVLTERAGTKDFVKVLDFGIAKRQSENDPNEAKLTQQGMVLGTPPYMSPEQFTGATIDARSDIYSLGVMAYEMLSGQLPFRANTAWEWATQHMQAQPIPLETQPHGRAVPAVFSAAISRAMSKSPNDRFPTVREFADAMSGAVQAYVPSSRPQPGAPVKGQTEYGDPRASFPGGTGAGVPGQAGMMGGAPMEPPNLTADLLGRQGMISGATPGTPGVASAYGPNVTPSAGNHAFPTGPNVIGHGLLPPNDASYAPKRSKAPLFAVLALLVLAGIVGGVGYGTGMFSRTKVATVDAGAPPQAKPAVAPPPATTSPPLAPLASGGANPAHPAVHDAGAVHPATPPTAAKPVVDESLVDPKDLKGCPALRGLIFGSTEFLNVRRACVARGALQY
jgi:serine/threonine protein kinase